MKRMLTLAGGVSAMVVSFAVTGSSENSVTPFRAVGTVSATPDGTPAVGVAATLLSESATVATVTVGDLVLDTGAWKQASTAAGRLAVTLATLDTVHEQTVVAEGATLTGSQGDTGGFTPADTLTFTPAGTVELVD